jgi:putative acetyltransferase
LIELETGPLSQVELAERLRLDKSTTSRIVARLVSKGWARTGQKDGRTQAVALTVRGREKLGDLHTDASTRVQHALVLLDSQQRAKVVEGMTLYARALQRSRLRARYRIRPIRRSDDPQVAQLIRTVMPEFGAVGPGFAIHDAEVSKMSQAYSRPRCAYFVLTDGKRVVGGGGIAPLEASAEPDTCELRKMYFYSEVRGLGLGQELITRCLAAARALGFRRCYLETLNAMKQARALYRRNGFTPLKRPEGNTGHFSCDAYYELDLTAS